MQNQPKCFSPESNYQFQSRLEHFSQFGKMELIIFNKVLGPN